MSSPTIQQPTPQLFFNTINSHVRTEALQAAINLEVFTAIGEGNNTAAQIAQRCGAAERGIRILCDYLCMMEFLQKSGNQYSLTQDSAFFLDKKSPAYVGGVTEFLLSPELMTGFQNLTEAVRKGGTAVPQDGTVAPENPIWVKFARAMVPMMALPAQMMAQMVDAAANSKLKILDIAAGHGMFGISFAKRNPNAEVTALDWKNVLEVAQENAQAAGVSDRYQTIPGSAFDADFGSGYDIVARSEIRIEGAAGNRLIAITDASSLRVLLSDFENILPIERCHFGIRISFRKADSEHAVSSCDVENLKLAVGSSIYHLRHHLCRQRHHRHHCARKLHPDRILRRDRSVLRHRCPALSDGFRKILKPGHQFGRQQKLRHAPNVGWRFLVEEKRRVLSQTVLIAALLQKFHHAEIITKDAYASFSRAAPLRNLRRCVVAFTNRGEDFQIYSGLQSFC